MVSDKHHVRLFEDREVDALSLSLSIVTFADGLISIFVPVYFWSLGFSIAKILLFYLLHSILYVAVSFLLLTIVRRLSDKMMIFLSIPFLILYFVGLSMMRDNGAIFYLLPIASSLHAFFFTIGYNINFSNVVERSEIGKNVGTRAVLNSVMQFGAPLFGGLLIKFSGFSNTFLIGSIVLLVSVIPLFFFPNRNKSSRLTVKSLIPFFKDPELQPFNISGVGYATEVIISKTIWPLFIFIAVGNIGEFGGIISLGLIVTALITYLVGFLSDYGRRRNVITVTTTGNALLWLIRPFIAQTPLIVGIHVGGNAIYSGLSVAWTSQFYKITKTVSNATAFIISREVLYNIARVVFIPILMAIAWVLPARVFFPVSFVIAAFATLLYLEANKTHAHLLTSLMTLKHVEVTPEEVEKH